MKLVKIISFTGTIHCETGISIRSLDDIAIGGKDSEVIKDPLTGEPYLPGSSLKGKMRSSLERRLGKVNERNPKWPCGCGRRDCVVCTLFGAHMNMAPQCGPTRLIVRDAPMTPAFRQMVADRPTERGSYLETKAENIIDRTTGMADKPRFFERVPAGASFELDIELQVFESDDEAKLVANVEEALRLVEKTYLGSSGSRGYGKVRFEYTKQITDLSGPIVPQPKGA